MLVHLISKELSIQHLRSLYIFEAVNIVDLKAASLSNIVCKYKRSLNHNSSILKLNSSENERGKKRR